MMKLFAGSSSIELAEEIANNLKIKISASEFERFSDRECIVRIKEEIKGETIYLLQSTCNPVNETLMELLIMADACLNNGAHKVHGILPYYGYSRQDRITVPGEPITTKLIAKLIEASGISSVTTMDIHSKATSESFNIPFNDLHFTDTLTKYLESKIKKDKKDYMIVGPDHGALERAERIAKSLGTDSAHIEKKRSKAEAISTMELQAKVKGKNVILVDDLIGTGGTIIRAAELLKKEGAEEVSVAATHGVFANDAVERLQNSIISEIIVSNTIPQRRRIDKLTVLSVAEEFSNFIKKI
ncbi:MAG: ribose-phosphate pyrophosphokinase [Candidatus Diapherotrites archaeon CG08_land_8_20_14_0_20_34_12]|nr:MAG: ribose-phosphate pyrophosphokinase [Candidatus Diapherotrites archaeon CG08_land_8_20_14_0_20_34_12]